MIVKTLAVLVFLCAAWPAFVSVALAQTTPAAASATAAPTTADLAARVADLEAYITNSTPKTLSSPGPGHNAWMMASSALVLFMTLPGLALFYGGLVRRKNVLSVMAQCLGCAGFVTVLWWAVGYSFAFRSGSPLLGGLKYAFLKGVGAAPNADYGAWVSHSVFAMYQLMFAIITPALIVGAIAERMKYPAIMAFLLGWMLLVYLPLAHMVWGVDGMMNGLANAKASIKAIDFAGGTVVHMSSGWSALALCLILGKRNGFGHRAFYPHSLVVHDDRHGNALGRMVRVQCWKRRGRGRYCRGCVHGDNPCYGRGLRHMAGDRMGDAWQAHRPRVLFGRRCWARRHHSGFGLRHGQRRGDHRSASQARCRTSPARSSSPYSATTTRSTRSASMAWAVRWAPS